MGGWSQLTKDHSRNARGQRNGHSGIPTFLTDQAERQRRKTTNGRGSKEYTLKGTVNEVIRVTLFGLEQY